MILDDVRKVPFHWLAWLLAAASVAVQSLALLSLACALVFGGAGPDFVKVYVVAATPVVVYALVGLVRTLTSRSAPWQLAGSAILTFGIAFVFAWLLYFVLPVTLLFMAWVLNVGAKAPFSLILGPKSRRARLDDALKRPRRRSLHDDPERSDRSRDRARGRRWLRGAPPPVRRRASTRAVPEGATPNRFRESPLRGD